MEPNARGGGASAEELGADLRFVAMRLTIAPGGPGQIGPQRCPQLRRIGRRDGKFEGSNLPAIPCIVKRKTKSVECERANPSAMLRRSGNRTRTLGDEGCRRRQLGSRARRDAASLTPGGRP